MMIKTLAAIVAVASFAVCSADDVVFGYVVNSDAAENADKLYQVELETGVAHEIGSLGVQYEDIEGLAFDEAGLLFATDDATDTLLSVNSGTGSATSIDRSSNNLRISNPRGDYGLTFTCSNTLWMSSDQEKTLYQVDTITGEAQLIAETGDIGLTALAAWGEKLYAINSEGNESLYEVNMNDGSLKLIGKLNTPGFEDAGMAFDETGVLWAITDGTIISNFEFGPSKIYQIDIETGSAQFIANTIGGVESLAIAPPGGCDKGASLATPIPTFNYYGIFALAIGLFILSLFFKARLKTKRIH